MTDLSQVLLSSLIRSRQSPPTDTALQLLNTDFGGHDGHPEAGGDTVRQFKEYYETWKEPQSNGQGQGSVDSTDDLVQALKVDKVAGLKGTWLHTVILSQRMTLNYSR